MPGRAITNLTAAALVTALDTPEHMQLVRHVDAVFGPEAVCHACDRAEARAAGARDRGADAWLRVFMAAFNDELRRLLVPH